MNHSKQSILTRRSVLAGAFGLLTPRIILGQTPAGCADNLGELAYSSGRYSLDTSFFTSAGWFPPIAPLSGDLLWTDKIFDYRSLQYNVNNPGFVGRHGGVDIVGSRYGSSSRPDQQYTEETKVHAIGAGVIRNTVEEFSSTKNKSRIYIEHEALDRSKFIATYLHCHRRDRLAVSDRVEAGEVIGTLRSYQSPVHLHFQIDSVLSARWLGGWHTGTQDPLVYLNNHYGSAAEITAIESKKRWYAPYIRNAIYLGVITNSDPDTGIENDRAWKRANVPVPRGELVAIIKGIADAYTPNWIRDNLPDASPSVNTSTIFPEDKALRGDGEAGIAPSPFLDTILLFARKGLVSSNPVTNPKFRLNDIASIGEATLMLWRTFGFSLPTGLSATAAYEFIRSKLQCADVATPNVAGYLIPRAVAGAASSGYVRGGKSELLRSSRKGWGSEKILTLEFFRSGSSDPSGYSLSATRAILAKLGINLVKYMAEWGTSAAAAMSNQRTDDQSCKYTSGR